MRRIVALFTTLLATTLLLVGCGGNSPPKVVTPNPTQEALAAKGTLDSQKLHKLVHEEKVLHQHLRLKAQAGLTLHGGRLRDASRFQDFRLGVQKRVGASGLLYGYDAVTLSYIPSRAQVVGCYVDGYANCASARVDFPHAHIVSISVHDNPADFADVEPGAMAYYQTPGFVKTMLCCHRSLLTTRLPGVYAGESWIGASISALNANHLYHGTSFLLWGAAWDNWAGVFSGQDAHQYASGCCVDRDVFLASAFSSSPAPKPKPKPNHEYTWFSHPKPAAGLIGPAITVSYQGKKYQAIERVLVENYDSARAKPQSGLRLKYEARLRYELHVFAQHLNALAKHASAKFNASIHRYGRIDNDLDRAMGNVVPSFQSGVNWGKTHNTSRWL